MSSCLNIRFPHLLVPTAVKECHTFFVLRASSTCCTNAVPLDIASWTRSYHYKIIVNCVIYAAIDLTFIKRWCQRDVSQENGSMLQLGDWILMFPLCFLLIMNFLRVIHLPHMLSQNIVQLANLPRLCMSFSRLGPEFIREPDDDLLLKFYSSFNWGLKLAQEQKR